MHTYNWLGPRAKQKQSGKCKPILNYITFNCNLDKSGITVVAMHDLIVAVKLL